MPPVFSVPSLRCEVQSAIGNAIFKYFQSQHRNCVECQELTVPGDVCKALEVFREELKKLPCHVTSPLSPIVFRKAAVVADNTDKLNLMCTTLNFFFHFKTLKQLRLRTDASLCMVMRFGSIVENLHLFHWERGHRWPTQESIDANSDKFVLANLMQMTPRLKVLNLHGQLVSVQSFLVAVSRNCHNIKELQQICVTEEITEYISQLFCYKNWSLKTDKNPCCQTIQIFDVYRKFQYIDPTKSEIKGLAVLCENLTNLKSFGDMFQVQKVLSRITDCDLNDESKLRNSVLNLKAASFQDCSVDEDFLPHLKDFSQLKRLHVKKIKPHPNYSMNDVVSCTGKLTELVSLELEFSENVNISMICLKCPNLIKLGLRVIAPGYVSVNEGSHRTFKNLEYFWICIDGNAGIDYDWLRLVAPNIGIMCIAVRNIQLGEESFLSSVEEHNLPKLQSIHFIKHGLTENGIKRLFQHCPVLETLTADFHNDLNIKQATVELRQLFGKNSMLYSVGSQCCFFHSDITNYRFKWSASCMSNCC